MTTAWRELKRSPATLIVGYGLAFWLVLQIGWSEYRHLLARALRLLKFSIVGISVLLIGVGLLYVLTQVFHWPALPAYALEAFVSVELNFLGSWFWTWRERRKETTFFRALWQFNLARSVSVSLNVGVFIHLWLGVFGLPLQVANLLNVIIASAWNYSAGENIIFAAGRRVGRDDYELKVSRQNPVVAIVIPCKRNEDEIRETVLHLANQNYRFTFPDKVRAYLVGDPDDPTWEPVEDLAQAPSNLKIVEVKVTLTPGLMRRDANGKRSVGTIVAYNDGAQVVGYADADIRPDPHWMWRAVSLLQRYDCDMVAGPVYGEGDTFWDRFIDRTTGITGSKTPRVPRAILLTAENLGEHKPPVTANLFVSQRVIDAIGEPPANFTWSYEDYAYVEKALAAGFKCLIHPDLGVKRRHRQGFKRLSGEYLRSGNGCGDFITVFRKSRFTVWRLIVMAALPLVMAGTAVAGAIAPVLTLAGLTAITISLMLTNLLATLPMRAPLPPALRWLLPKGWRAKGIIPRFDGLVYPFIGIYFSLRFVYGVCQRFRRLGLNPPPMPTVGPPVIVRFGPHGRIEEGYGH